MSQPTTTSSSRSTRTAPTPTGSTLNPSHQAFTNNLAREAQDKRTLRRAIAAAVAVHLALLAITFPSLGSEAAPDPERPKAYVIKHVRFKPKPPDKAPVIPEPRKRRMPMPDPTPDDPEVLSQFEPEIFDDIPIDASDARRSPVFSGGRGRRTKKAPEDV